MFVAECVLCLCVRKREETGFGSRVVVNLTISDSKLFCLSYGAETLCVGPVSATDSISAHSSRCFELVISPAYSKISGTFIVDYLTSDKGASFNMHLQLYWLTPNLDEICVKAFNRAQRRELAHTFWGCRHKYFRN